MGEKIPTLEAKRLRWATQILLEKATGREVREVKDSQVEKVLAFVRQAIGFSDASRDEEGK